MTEYKSLYINKTGNEITTSFDGVNCQPINCRISHHKNHVKAHKKYLKNRKKSVKHIKFSYQQLMGLDEKFNKFHGSPEIICYEYNREFGIKFPVCFKTLYKYVFLGLFGLNKCNLYFHGQKNKSKQIEFFKL